MPRERLRGKIVLLVKLEFKRNQNTENKTAFPPRLIFLNCFAFIPLTFPSNFPKSFWLFNYAPNPSKRISKKWPLVFASCGAGEKPDSVTCGSNTPGRA